MGGLVVAKPAGRSLPGCAFKSAYPAKIAASRRSMSALAIMHGLRSASSDGGESPYSVRKACIGSIRDALQAGTRQASAATSSSVAATAAKIAGSSGRVP